MMLKIDILLSPEVEALAMESLAIGWIPTLNLELIKVVKGDVACVASSHDPLDFYKLGILVANAANAIENTPQYKSIFRAERRL